MHKKNRRLKSLISIITVVFNDKYGLEETILSVLSQTSENIEYIIIDGGSNDGTVDVIKKYEKCIDKWISEPDNGIYDAMNKGIALASGGFINFMNAGDVYASNNIIEKIIFYIDDNTDVLFGDYISYFHNKKYIVKASESNIYNDKIPNMGFNHQASFVKTELAKKYPFDLKYKLAADFNMMVTLCHKGYHFSYVGLPIAIYEGNGASAKNILLHRYECLTSRGIHGVFMNKVIAIKMCFFFYCRKIRSNLIYRLSPKIIEAYYRKKRDLIEYE